MDGRKKRKTKKRTDDENFLKIYHASKENGAKSLQEQRMEKDWISRCETLRRKGRSSQYMKKKKEP